MAPLPGNTVIVQPTRSNRVQINHLASTGREALTADIGGAVVPPEYADLLRRIKEKENRVRRANLKLERARSREEPDLSSAEG